MIILVVLVLVSLWYLYSEVVCEYICFVRDREMRELKYLRGSQSFPSY